MIASCCILSYNRPKFLQECIESLHERTHEPIEIIVHDDGSEDKEVIEYLNEALSKKWITALIRNPPGHNQGQGVALNRMFRMASGDLLVKVDQDLIFKDNWLAAVRSIFRQNDEMNLRYRQPKIGLLGLFHYAHDPVDSRKCKIEQYGGWQSHTHICGSGFVIDKHSYIYYGAFEEYSEAFAEDWEYQKRISNWHEDRGGPQAVCALPDYDLVENQGFGIGPSTIVKAENDIQTIHKAPAVITL